MCIYNIYIYIYNMYVYIYTCVCVSVHVYIFSFYLFIYLIFLVTYHTYLRTSDSSFALTFVDHHLLPNKKFNGHCLVKK